MDREAAGRRTVEIVHQLGTVSKTDIVLVFDNISVAEWEVSVCGKPTGRERRVERNELWVSAEKSRFQY